MIRVIASLVLLVGAQSAIGECLSVEQPRFERQSTQSSIEQVIWRAEIANRCERAFDADLRARFLDVQGSLVYELRDLVTVAPHRREEAGRSTHMPAQYLPRIAKVEVVIAEERERPY